MEEAKNMQEIKTAETADIKAADKKPADKETADKEVTDKKAADKEAADKKTRKTKTAKKRFPWAMTILTVLSVAILIGMTFLMSLLDSFDVLSNDKSSVLKDKMELLQDRYAVFALSEAERDYNMPEIKKTNLHMGIFKGDTSDINERALSDPDNYVVHNFDDNFDYKNAHIFQTYIDSNTYFTFNMENVLGYAKVVHKGDPEFSSVTETWEAEITGFYYDWMTDKLYIDGGDCLYCFEGSCGISEESDTTLSEETIYSFESNDNIETTGTTHSYLPYEDTDVEAVTPKTEDSQNQEIRHEYDADKYGIRTNLDPRTHSKWLNENLTVELYGYNYRIPFSEIVIIRDMDLKDMNPVIKGTLLSVDSGKMMVEVYGNDSAAAEEEKSDRTYYTVVSYLDSPLESNGEQIDGTLNAFNLQWSDADLFVQAYVLINAMYSWKYVIIVFFAVFCILVCGCGIFWFIKFMLLILRIIGRVRLIWKTGIILAAGGFFLLMCAASGEPEAAVVIFSIYLIFICPSVLYIVWEYRKQMMACEELAKGNLKARVDTGHMIWDLKKQGENINTISEGINKAVDEQLKSERMKAELITNVSHDIKTPLTSIINYVDLLSREEIGNEKAMEYLEVLNRQSDKLKKLIVDLIEASKASTGNLEIHAELCDARMALLQVVGEYEEKLKDNKITLILNEPEEKAMIMADGRYLFRIFDNVMQNIRKYALENTRAYIDLLMDDETVILTFKNISRDSLNVSGEEFTERFYRGDSSRNTEGNGLGLAIVKSLAELMNGTVTIIVDGDLFKVEIRFPKAEQS